MGRTAYPSAAGLRDGPVADGLHRLVRLTAASLHAPAAVVSLSDGGGQVVVAATGIDDTARPVTASVCARVAARDAASVVTDARVGRRERAAQGKGAAAWAGLPLHDADGRVLGTLCALDTRPHVWDAAQLALADDLAHLAEDEIVAHRQVYRLRAVLEHAYEAVVDIDAAGRIRTWTSAAEQRFGRSAAEALGRPLGELVFVSASRPTWQYALQQVRADGTDVSVEATLCDRDGRAFPAEVSVRTGIAPVAADGFGGQAGPVLSVCVRDISDQQAAKQLEEERTFLRALLDSLDVAVIAAAPDGRAVFASRTMRQLHSHAPLPPTIKGAAASLHLFEADGRTPLRDEQTPLACALAGQYLQGRQLVTRPPGQTSRYLSVNARPITGDDGRTLGAVIAVHDITAQRRTQMLRQAQHSVAQALAEAADSEQAATGVLAGVVQSLGWVCGEYWEVEIGGDAITRLASWNTPGWDVSRFTGDRTLTFERGHGLAGLVWARGEAMWSADLPADRRDVTRIRQALQAGLHTAIGLPVHSGGQKVLGVLTFFTDAVQEPDADLTDMLKGICAQMGRYLERRHAEELTVALAENRRQFERLVAQVNDNIWTAEIMADGKARPVYISASGLGVLGQRVATESDDMIDFLTRLVHPEDRPAFDAYCRTLRGGRPAQLEYRLTGLDGRTRWIWTRALPRREGERLFVDGVSTDVTSRHLIAEERERLLARQQEQVRRLRELDAMKDELMALVTHELRNPIGAIRGYAEMLADDTGLTSGQRRFVEVIDRKTAHLQHLVDDLLELARFESGCIALTPQPVALGELVADAVVEHRPAAQAKRLTVTAEVAGEPTVHGDPVRLRQVLDNLLSNSIKYTPGGGSVAVTVRSDDNGGGGEDARPQVVLSVADSGIGVPPEQYDQLFTRFFRASTALDAGIEGTGLGLSITRAIVEAHGGAVAAAPGAQGGTVFTVRLPAAPVASSSH
ncbi:PAS domain S-box protein [Planomonospora sp. ID67723]|uniref:PAS domain-containing sensor histidine kinase n=1 Tax=Planomonospora sp. ID67723 TaxID=2738134 RepID=UPI0018C356E9|nr:ATP-binding protein [Planomonospora sp. ID67723]MBG0833192.1 PAS domain S-box protein [Planomonospora sp. ID67723]